VSRLRLILHIGQHKTGSKALQSFLAHHTSALKGRKILYPSQDPASLGVWAYAISQYRLFALLRKEAMEACGELRAASRFWQEQKVYAEPFESVRSLLEASVKQAFRDRAETLLLSAEDLFDMHSAHELDFSMDRIGAATQRLARILTELEYDTTVVVYLRRQDHLLGSHYVQYIKGSNQNDLDFATFAKAFKPRLRLCEILTHWASAFGVTRIKVRRYEPSALPSGIVPDFFLHVLGFPVPEGWAPPPRHPESLNWTPAREFVEFIRILNRRQASGLTVFRREDVLEAALPDETFHQRAVGISAWLSPKARRSILQTHAAGNAEIAGRFLLGSAQTLFMEPVPKANEKWQEYPGLSPSRAIEIALRIHEIAINKGGQNITDNTDNSIAPKAPYP
jgi:hypothetical protein